jgi:2-methylcitrate dehydratase PrpD
MERLATNSTITNTLLDKVMALRWQDGRPDLPLLIKQSLLDWLGVSIAAAADPPVQVLREELEEQGGHPQAFVFGSPKRLPTQQAALLNGTISHLLDYDDVNLTLPGHCTAPILAAVLALAERNGANGSEVMNAFLTGYETTCRIALLVAPGHFTRGFHATATIGSLGAAAACARLIGLDRSATARSLGIAATRAAGLKAMFGTSCKALQVGASAATGVFATTLARRGFDSREDALECAQGFAATHSSDFNGEAALRDPEAGYHLFNNLFKFHAACYETQAILECGHRLRQAHGFLPDEIRAVRVRANNHCNEICNIAEPQTGMEMKFSLRATAALSLAGMETSRPDVFNDVNAQSPALNRLRAKIAVELTPDLALAESEMHVELHDGRRFSARQDCGIPMKDRAEQGRRVADKFQALAAPVLGRNRSDLLVSLVEKLETSSVDVMVGACV